MNVLDFLLEQWTWESFLVAVVSRDFRVFTLSCVTLGYRFYLRFADRAGSQRGVIMEERFSWLKLCDFLRCKIKESSGLAPNRFPNTRKHISEANTLSISSPVSAHKAGIWVIKMSADFMVGKATQKAFSFARALFRGNMSWQSSCCTSTHQPPFCDLLCRIAPCLALRRQRFSIF